MYTYRLNLNYRLSNLKKKQHRNKLWNKEKKRIQYTYIGKWGDRLEMNISINISLTKIYYISITHKS